MTALLFSLFLLAQSNDLTEWRVNNQEQRITDLEIAQARTDTALEYIKWILGIGATAGGGYALKRKIT